jgi:small subunit ribosomal protein S6
MTRPYEIVYIFDSALEEEQVKTHLASFHELLKSPEKPEPVTNSNHWGKRTLAYPIKGRDVGYYVVEEFDTLQANLTEFERLIKLNESVLRYLVVLNDGEQPRAISAEGGLDRRHGGDESDPKPGDGSDRRPGDGSDRKPSDGSDRKPGDDSDRKPGDDSDRKPDERTGNGKENSNGAS